MYYSDSKEHLVAPPSDEWKPVYWTEMKSSATLGDDIIDFVESTYRAPRGKFQGELLKLADWQKWLLRHIFELDSFGNFRYSEVYIQIPRKQGKTLLGSAIGNYFATRGVDGDEIYYVATNFKQANILFKAAKDNIIRTELEDILDVKAYEVKNRFKNITMQPLTAKPSSAQGLAPYISVCDELHVWDSKTGTSQAGVELLNALITGESDREESMVIEITTAGSNIDGLAHGRYQLGKKIARGEIKDDSFGCFIWEAEDQDDIFSMETLKKANPGISAGYISLEKMKKKLALASQTSTADFERLTLNKWLKKSEDIQFILGYYWDKVQDSSIKSLHERVKNGERPKVTLGFDGSLTEDSTGIVAIDVETKAMEVLYKWEKDYSDDNWAVDLEEVDYAFRQCFKDFEVVKAYCDPSRHHAMVQLWQKSFSSHVVRDIPPTAVRMNPMAQQFRNDLYAGKLKHNGDERFRQHVTNAVESISGLPKKETRNSTNKIDFLVCAILANGALVEHEKLSSFSQKSEDLYKALARKN